VNSAEAANADTAAIAAMHADPPDTLLLRPQISLMRAYSFVCLTWGP